MTDDDEGLAYMEADADAALALFQRMSTPDLRCAQRAYLLDAESERAGLIFFAAGRAALVAHVLRQREGEGGEHGKVTRITRGGKRGEAAGREGPL